MNIYIRCVSLLILFVALTLSGNVEAGNVEAPEGVEVNAGIETTSYSLTEDWSAGIPESGEKAFWITRKGKNIGFHYMTFKPRGNKLHVDIHIEIGVKIGFIPVFGYVHHNKEIWQDGQLISMESRTDNNGTIEFANITRNEQGQLISNSSKYSGKLEKAQLTTSYFNPNFIRQSHVISTQDGRELEIEAYEVGLSTLNAASRTVEARRFRLVGDLPLDIWYTPKGEWIRSAFLPAGDNVNNVDPLSRGDVLTYEDAMVKDLPARSAWRSLN